MSEKLLSVKNLRINFGKDNQVIHDISFDVISGEIIGIVGESGSGKSVTSHAIMRLLDKKAIVEGEIKWKGLDLLTIPEKKMPVIRGKEISMIFQEPMSSLNPTIRCGHQVTEALTTHNLSITKTDATETVKELFSQVMLPDIDRIYDAYPHELSGGQLQRVMIAMAMINYPDLIIADEPTTALDVTVQKGIIELLQEVKKQRGCSIIFISHDLGIVKSIADRVIVMQKGNIVEQGSTDQIFNHPEHPYTKGLIACRPPLERRMKRLPTVQDFMEGRHEIGPFVSSLTEDQSVWQQRLATVNAAAQCLTVKDLKVWYPTRKNLWGTVKEWKKAVDGVSFDIKKGQIMGLVGESGSGKSTIGKSVLRLIEPTSGQIQYEGRDILSLEGPSLRKLRKDIQIIFQDPYSSLNPRMKIGEAIREPLQIHNMMPRHQQKDRVVQLLEMVGLSADHYNRYPHQFSGGQRQRICIARTLSIEPSFIVCDESVSALDVSVQAQILNLLLDLKERLGLSYLFITHDISVVKFLCDEVLVLKDGKIIERSNAEDIYHHPQDPYTRRLIEAVYQ